jgi:uncharacterized protein with HEPN domain
MRQTQFRAVRQSRRLPNDVKDRHPAIEWQQMAAAGNIYRHEYENVAARGVWSTVRDHLPQLLVVVEAEIAAIETRAAGRGGADGSGDA